MTRIRSPRQAPAERHRRRCRPDPIERVEHELEPWEKRCHALADVLDFHKIINTEEKRRGVEALGASMIGKLTYYERWIVAFANILFQKGILTPEELALKMDEVSSRHGGDADSARAGGCRSSEFRSARRSWEKAARCVSGPVDGALGNAAEPHPVPPFIQAAVMTSLITLKCSLRPQRKTGWAACGRCRVARE